MQLNTPNVDPEFCMNFSNEEILTHIVRPARKLPDVKLRILNADGEDVSEDAQEAFDCVVFDGMDENLYLSFGPIEVSLYACNARFMFIDDAYKSQLCFSDTNGEILYEGKLRDKSREEILALLFRLVRFLQGADAISLEEHVVVPGTISSYPVCEYMVDIESSTMPPQVIHCENICLRVNADRSL